MAQTKIYIADLSTWYSSSSELDNVMECAESQGTVFTLDEFIDNFNNGELTNLLIGDDVVMAHCLEV